MTVRSNIVAEIAALQVQLAILDGAPVDNYTVGTVARFASNSNQSHMHIIKTVEENWKRLSSGDPLETDLANWIRTFTLSNPGYFELYILATGATPIYASS